MNQIVLLGRLAKDPELKYTANGTAVCRFTLAVTRENDRNKADFIYCLAFGKLAESTANYCQKGRQILLNGRLEINTNKNQQTNQTETYTNVIANTIEFLAKPQGDSKPPVGNRQQQGETKQQQFQGSQDGWRVPDDSEYPF